MSAIARTLGLLLGCASFTIACSQPRPAPAETEADAPAEEDQSDLVDDSTVSAVDASADQFEAGETAGLGDAETSDSTPPPCNPADCDDGWVCTADECKAGTCIHSPMDATPCDDSDPCTVGEGCVEGSCGGGSDASCDDGNSCTFDSCDTGQGCVHKATLAACSDGDACTSGEACKAGTCVGGTPKFCGDGNFCTDDSCDSAKGCVFTPNSAPCDSDSNVCTVDTCAGGKCAYLPVAGTSTACDDGTPCTQEDHCEKGKCVGAPAVWTRDFLQESGLYQPGYHAKHGISVGTYQNLHGFDWTGQELWFAPGYYWFVSPTTSGWLAGAGEVMLSPMDAAGALVGQPTQLLLNGKALQAGEPVASGDGMLLPVRSEASSCWQIMEVDGTGQPLQTLAPKKCYAPNSGAVRRSAGDFLFSVQILAAGALDVGLLRVNPSLGTVEEFPSPKIGQLNAKYWNDVGTGAIAEASDGALVLARIRVVDDAPQTLGVHLWRLSPIGDVIWSQLLTLPGPSPTTVAGRVAVATIANGEIEVWAGTQPVQTPLYNEPFASWRLASDGRVLWMRGESERRRVVSWSSIGVGNGVVGPAAYYDYLLPAGTGYRLTRSDAYGNITCAESGPCWDKPATYCDDGDPCTNDLCGAQWKGCHHEPFAEGAPCKPGKTCKKGQCVP